MSRYSYCWNKTLSTGELRKLPRGFFYFQKFSDTEEHTCKEGETLFQLASIYYREAFPFAAMLYWIIADFQPVPIIDSTVVFQAAQVVYIPSIRTINLLIMSPTREPEFETW